MSKRIVPIKPLPPAMPRCWDRRDDWAEWVRLNKIAGPVDRAKSLEHFCVDCSKEYADRMIAAGRCAYPDPATRPEKVKPHD